MGCKQAGCMKTEDEILAQKFKKQRATRYDYLKKRQ